MLTDILNKIGITEEEAIFLFKHLMSEVEEESYLASQKMFEEVAQRCGYSSYLDYLERSSDCF